MFLPDPVALTLNLFGKSINIYWYGILIATGIMACIILAVVKGRKIGMDTDDVLDMSLWTIVLGILGARLYYVVFSWDLYRGNLWSVFEIWNGGLAIYGGIIAGALGVYIYSRRNNRSFLKIIDILVPGLVFAQALGRWGNFFNQEAFGTIVTNPDLQWFPYAVYIEATQTFHMATFFYESAWNILVLIGLLIYGRKERLQGNILFLYLALYGTGRMFIEALRTDSLYIGSIRVSQLLSVILVVFGVAMLLFRNIKKDSKKQNNVNPDLKLVDESDLPEGYFDDAEEAEEAFESVEEAEEVVKEVEQEVKEPEDKPKE